MFALKTENFNPELLNNAKLMYFSTLYKLQKYNECSQEVAEFIKTIKDNNLIKKTLFILADIYKGLNNLEGEKSILQKILVMAPVDELSRVARQRMDSLK
jgi:hypothetical protein